MAKLRTIIFNFLLITAIKSGICQEDNPDEHGNYIEGDIIGSIPVVRTRSGMLSSRLRWPNGIIPYEFAPSYPASLQRLYKRAAEHISSRTCVKVVPRTTERDYIQIISGNGCYSYVGRVGGRQVLSLPSSCRTLGTFVHETVHAIGFVHEHSRTDRDDYVKVNWGNIRSGMANNFNKLGSNTISGFGNYDYASVMHYSSYAFSKDRNSPTLEPKENPRVEIGQRRGLSPGDIQKINNMYCPVRNLRI